MLPETVENKIRKIIQATNPSVYVVELALHKSKRSLLSVVIDTDAGISLPECTEISRAISRYLDMEEPLDLAFNLEVSSPGVGKPLKLERQYHRHIGHDLKVKLKDGSETTGHLLSVEDKGITLRPAPEKKKKGVPVKQSDEKVQIQFDQIQEAIVLISFN